MSSVSTPAESSAKLLDVQAVAEMLGVSQRHIYRMADGGKMPQPLKVGSLNRWPQFSIEEWISSGCPRCDRRAKR